MQLLLMWLAAAVSASLLSPLSSFFKRDGEIHPFHFNLLQEGTRNTTIPYHYPAGSYRWVLGAIVGEFTLIFSWKNASYPFTARENRASHFDLLLHLGRQCKGSTNSCVHVSGKKTRKELCFVFGCTAVCGGPGKPAHFVTAYSPSRYTAVFCLFVWRES